MAPSQAGSVRCAPQLRRRRSDGERTRVAIAEAAVAQIADHGLAGTTQRRVAQRAGVSLAAVTYHFATLEALFDAGFDHLIDQSVARLTDLKRSAEQGSITLADAWEEVVRDEQGNTRATVAAGFELLVAAARDPRLRPAAQRLLDALNAFFLTWTTRHDPARSVLSLLLGLSLTEAASGHPLAPRDIGGILSLFVDTPGSDTCRSAPTFHERTPCS